MDREPAGRGWEERREAPTIRPVVLIVDDGPDNGTAAKQPWTSEDVARRKAPHPERAILVVEDEESARLALAELLSSEGYRVLAAASPSEALETAGREGPIDLLISDVHLPEMKGNALAVRLRSTCPRMQVIFTSGLPEPPDPSATFVQKPVDIDVLLEVIERTLRRAEESGSPL